MKKREETKKKTGRARRKNLGRNGKKTGRREKLKKQEETGKNRKKWEETGRKG